MDSTIQTYLPQPNSPEQNFTILLKDDRLSNLNNLIVTSYSGTFESLQEKYLDLLSSNSQQPYIVTEQFANEFNAQKVGQSDSAKFSQEDIAQIVNNTKEALSINGYNILTEAEVIEKRKKEEEELAKQLGLIVNPESFLNQFLPQANEPDTTFAIIARNKNNADFKQMKVVGSNDSLQFNDAKNLIGILDNQNNNELEYFMVTTKLAQQLSSLNNDVILNAINRTQPILGFNKEIVIAPPSVAQNVDIPPKKIATPKLDEILAKNAINETAPQEKTVPTPEAIQNNYKPLADTLKMFNDEKYNAKLKKSPLSKKLVGTSLGLLGVGLLSMSLSPIVMPAAFVIGGIALVKHTFGHGDKAEVKLWTKREKLLKKAALTYVGGGEFDGKIDIKVIEKISLTPEIIEEFNSLCKKANIAITNLNVGKVRENAYGNAEKSNDYKKKG